MFKKKISNTIYTTMPRTPTKSGSNVASEVAKLMNTKNKAQALARLRSKYDDQEIVSQIQEAFKEAHQKIVRRAKKFAQLIREKYGDSNQPLHALLEKAHKYKKAKGLSDAEFTEFQRILEQELAGVQSLEVSLPNTNMMKVLGNVTTDASSFHMKLSDDDFRKMQEIVSLYRSSRPLHAQVMLQSMQYVDCNPEALTGTYDRNMGHMPSQHVHPVVAALFLPKIDVLESHFLYSNLAGIVAARKEKRALTTRPDYDLFYSLVTDPNDIVCDNRSPVADLLARANLQQQLWNSVVHLRNGQYYNASFNEFVGAVDVCKMNKHDNPDLIYGRHDGTVLKRLVSAFSFRPTVVATTPVVQTFSHNPYTQNLKPQVRSVHMINLRLTAGTLSDNSAVHLNDSLEQTQLFLEGANIVPKNTSLIYSRGVLIFYVDRRANVMRVANNEPFNLSRLPTAVAGFERHNDRQVLYDETIRVRGDEYQLRSVVINELNRNDPHQHLVVGSSALIRQPANLGAGRFTSTCLHYDPLGVSEARPNATGERVGNDPITSIPYGPGVGAAGTDFVTNAQTKGTVFIYELTKDDSEGLVNY